MFICLIHSVLLSHFQRCVRVCVSKAGCLSFDKEFLTMDDRNSLVSTALLV